MKTIEQLTTLTKLIVGPIVTNFPTFELAEQKIDSSSILISFHSDRIDLVFKGSLHHLDVPWQVTSDVKIDGRQVESIEKYCDAGYNYDRKPRYELSPKVLENENGEFLLLVDAIIGDLKKYVAGKV